SIVRASYRRHEPGHVSLALTPPRLVVRDAVRRCLRQLVVLPLSRLLDRRQVRQALRQFGNGWHVVHRSRVDDHPRTDPVADDLDAAAHRSLLEDRKSTRLNSSHVKISYAVFCLKKKNKQNTNPPTDRLTWTANA